MSEERAEDRERQESGNGHDNPQTPGENNRHSRRENKKHGLSGKQLRAYECLDNLFMLNKIQGALLTQLEKEIL